MKTETWNGHTIRFIEHGGEWWAVAKDVAEALNYSRSYDMVRMIEEQDKGTHNVRTLGGRQEMLIISEFGIYEAIFNSRKLEAQSFKRWVYKVLQRLRTNAGLEAYEAFKLMDKEHQKTAMENLHNGLKNPKPKHYIKANTIADKAVSNVFGYEKMIKKKDMSTEMLKVREQILEQTVELMKIKETYDLDFSVKEIVYENAGNPIQVTLPMKSKQ